MPGSVGPVPTEPTPSQAGANAPAAGAVGKRDAAPAEAAAGPVTVGVDARGVVDALTVAGRIGPFFAVVLSRNGPGWVPLDDLVNDPRVLAERVEAARVVIARSAGQPPESVEPRVAASIVFLGIAARLISPPLATTALTGIVPRWASGRLWMRPVTGGPWPLAAEATTGDLVEDLDSAAGRAEAIDRLLATVVGDVIHPVLDAVGDQFRVSGKILAGNVASGLAGAVGLLAAARPDRAHLAYGLAEGLLGSGLLRHAGVFVRSTRASERRPTFVRRSCCLFYRVPGAGTCGDCVLTAPAEARAPRPT